jgi:ABC-type antimicrobial peptide transport system permease subunit
MLASLLFGVEAFDPTNILTVVILATVVTVAASYLPARRASRVDPMTAVRGD